MFVSTDGRTFDEPPATWKPSSPSGGPRFRGSFQSLAGDLIRDGITGVSGHVTEPFLDATIRPQILFPAYLAGLNLAESYYLAMPFLSWQTVVIGDPLCAPFQKAALPPDRLHKGLDAATDLPALFAERRLAALNTEGLQRRSAQPGAARRDPALRDPDGRGRCAARSARPTSTRASSLAQTRLADAYRSAGDTTRPSTATAAFSSPTRRTPSR